MNITKKDLNFITITEILLIIKTNLGVYRFMPIWHQSPKLTPRYFLETPRLFGYPFSWSFQCIELDDLDSFLTCWIKLHH